MTISRCLCFVLHALLLTGCWSEAGGGQAETVGIGAVSGTGGASNEGALHPAAGSSNGRAEGGSGNGRAEAGSGNGHAEEGVAPAEVNFERSSLSADTTPQVADPDYEAFIASANRFGLELMQEMVQTGILVADGNQVFSPSSVVMALGMLYAGASGDTRAEMKAVLHDELPEGVYHSAHNRLLRELLSRNHEASNSAGETLRLHLSPVDSIWLDQTLSAEPAYLDLLSQEYDTGLHRVSFLDEPEAARVAINDWVEEQTGNRIEELIPSGQISELTRLVLVNALYFNGHWETLFDQYFTQDRPFTTLDGAKVTVPMMQDMLYFDYKEVAAYQVLDLPFLGGEVVMTFVLPAAGEFENARAEVSESWLATATSDLEETQVRLVLPKFKIASGSLALGSALSNLGMPSVFAAGADFSGLSHTEGISVNDVVQQAFIGTDEEGCEAAAATAEYMAGGIPVSVPDFYCDRPFLYFIRDSCGLVLFSGQVVDPS